MCAKFLRQHNPSARSRAYLLGERFFSGLLGGYERRLRWVLRHQTLVLAYRGRNAGLDVYLYIIVPKGFFPQQDTGRIGGAARASRTFPSTP